MTTSDSDRVNSPPGPAPATNAPPSILVVEDEAIVALDIQAHLKVLGYAVAGTTANGRDALRLVEARRPDLILMDIRIQGDMDGIDTALEIRTRFGLPVVFLTAYSEDSTLQRAKLAEPYGYVLKPFEERELKSIIELALYKHGAEQEILRLNRLYATLSQVNQAVVRVRHRQELFDESCRIAIEFGGFQLALVRWHNPETKDLETLASAGEALRVLQEESESPETPDSQATLCDQAFSSDCTRVVRDLLNEPGLGHQAARLQRAGLHAGAVLPIRFAGAPAGVLAVFSAQANAFQDREIGLLEEMATDISFALDNLAAEERRRQAEEALATSERKFRSIFESMANGSCYNEIVCDPAGKPLDYRILDVNPAHQPILGVNREQACGNLASEVYGEPPFLEVFAGVAESGQPVTFETWFPHARKHLRVTVSCPEKGRFTTLFSDITEEKLRVEELARLRADLEKAQEVAHVGSWGAESPDQGVLTWSAETYRIFGLEPEAFDDRVETFLKYIHPDDRDRLVRAAEAAWRDDVPYDIEHRLIRPDGSVRWVHEMAQIERDEAGHPIRMVGVVRDVTEHREARARLRLQGTALQATANTVMITDRDGHIEWVNAAFERMTGYPTAEVIGKKPSLLKSGRQDSGYYQELWTTILAGKVWEGEMINRRKDGSVYIEESTITPLSDADGRISHFITIKQDVTDRKQADERLRAESAFRRSIIEHAAEGICVWEPIDEAPGAHFSVWNPRMIEMTGYTMEEINRQGWTETMYRDPEEQARAAIRMRKAIDTDCRGSIEITLTHKDGNPRTVILSYRRLDSAETRQRLLVMMIDVTEQRRIERERREIEAQARHRERLAALGTLAGGVAHEINNPVNGIMNYADIIGEGLPPDSPLREFVNEIQHETHRVTEIVKNLLSFARQDQAPPHPTGIPEIVEGTLSLVHALFKRDHIHLKVHLDPDLPPLTGHGNRLQQVVMNLMTNARDALNQRFPGHDLEKQLHVEAHSLEREGQTWVRLTVEDHGAGIPEEVRQQMFEPFFTTKGREEGTGLGLAISHGIVKEHGGEIRCESEPGRFTRFHVDLPADAPPPPETPGAPAAPGTA